VIRWLWWGLLLLAIVLGATPSWGAVGSFPLDDLGRPSGGCAYLNASGVWTACSTTNQLPVSTSISSLTDVLGRAPVQGATLLNSQTTGAANTAVTATLTGAANTRVHLYSLAAWCSAGSASLTVQDGATTIWSTPTGTVGTTILTAAWPVGLTATTAANLVVTLGACGANNTGTLIVQADRF
jgi:hypothetical protein